MICLKYSSIFFKHPWRRNLTRTRPSDYGHLLASPNPHINCVQDERKIITELFSAFHKFKKSNSNVYLIQKTIEIVITGIWAKAVYSQYSVRPAILLVVVGKTSMVPKVTLLSFPQLIELFLRNSSTRFTSLSILVYSCSRSSETPLISVSDSIHTVKYIMSVILIRVVEWRMRSLHLTLAIAYLVNVYRDCES